MQAISDYLYCVFVVSAAGGLLLLLAPGEGGGSVRPAYRYLVSLAVVIAVISPLFPLPFSLPEMSVIDTPMTTADGGIAAALAETVTTEAVEERLSQALLALFGRPFDVILSVTCDNDEIRILSATIRSETDDTAVQTAADYLSSLLGCAVGIEIPDNKGAP